MNSDLGHVKKKDRNGQEGKRREAGLPCIHEKLSVPKCQLCRDCWTLPSYLSCTPRLPSPKPVCLFPDRRLWNYYDWHFLLRTSIACMHGPDGAGPWKGTAGRTILGYGFGPVTPSHALPRLRGNDNAGVVELSRDVPAAEPRGSDKPCSTIFQRKQKAPGAPFSGHSPKTEHRKGRTSQKHGVLLLAVTHSSHHHCLCLPLNSSRHSETASVLKSPADTE